MLLDIYIGWQGPWQCADKDVMEQDPWLLVGPDEQVKGDQSMPPASASSRNLYGRRVCSIGTFFALFICMVTDLRILTLLL